MSRPLLITDCDEVLLHMVVPFSEWLDEEHHIHFALDQGEFVDALRCKQTGRIIPGVEIWPLLQGFFKTEMHRQQAIDGAVEAVTAIGRDADVVVLTNLTDEFNAARGEQLRAVGIDVPVVTNQGGKGTPLARLVAEYNPSIAIFVDDLAHQHQSAAEHAPDVLRLHMVGEPRLQPNVKTPACAQARIDDWRSAHRWIIDRFEGKPL